MTLHKNVIVQVTDTLVGEEDWGCGLLDVKPQVILHDRLMTDAALGTTTLPIKSEHSYCSLTSGSDSPPDSPLKMEEGKLSFLYQPLSCTQRSSMLLIIISNTLNSKFRFFLNCLYTAKKLMIFEKYYETIY